MNNSMQTLDLILPYIMTTIIFVFIGVMIISLLNYTLKRRIIRMGQIDEDAVKLLSKPLGLQIENLKWALILFFGGLGLVVLEFIPYSAEQSSLPYGIEAIFLALGFFVYYFLAQKAKQ